MSKTHNKYRQNKPKSYIRGHNIDFVMFDDCSNLPTDFMNDGTLAIARGDICIRANNTWLKINAVGDMHGALDTYRVAVV